MSYQVCSDISLYSWAGLTEYAATEMKERIEAFKSERLGDKKKVFIDTVTQEAPKSAEEANAMDVTEG